MRKVTSQRIYMCAAFVLYPRARERIWMDMYKKKKSHIPIPHARERLCAARCDQHKYGSLKKSQLVSYRILYSKHEHLLINCDLFTKHAKKLVNKLSV